MGNFYKLIFLLTTFCFLIPSVYAIKTPESVDYLEVELTRYGQIGIEKLQPNYRIDKIETLLFLPQADTRQKVEILSVTPSNYEIVNDSYGNKQIKLTWITPQDEILNYEVKSKVEITPNHVFDVNNPVFLKETELTKSSEQMIEKALEFRGEDFERLANLLIWLNKYLTYDITVEDVYETVKSAEWAFENRVGVCDEFSNLFISMARALGYPSRYAGGLVYSENFTEHGWAEVFIGNKWVPFDPTWLEAGYVDATHLKLASLPDGNFSESIFIEGHNVNVSWILPTKSEVKILSEKEEPPVQIQTQLINQEIGPQGYIIFKANIVPNQCLIASQSLESCVDDSPVFEVFDEEKAIAICNSSDVYWVAEHVGNISKGFIHYCPLTLNSNFGIYLQENATIDSTKYAKELTTSKERITVTLNQKFKITVDTEGEVELYSLYLNQFNTTSFTEKEDFDFIAPSKYGNYKVWFINSDGAGKSLDLEVIKQELVNISWVEFPENVTSKEWFLINVSLDNLVNRTLEGNLTLIGEKTVSRFVTLVPFQQKTESFNISLEKTGIQEIKLIVDVEEDYDVSILQVQVQSKTPIPFFKAIWNYLVKLFNLFLSLLQQK